MEPAEIRTFDELEALLRRFTNWGSVKGEESPYDSVGVLHLLAALLENMDANYTPVDYEELGPILEARHLKVLETLARYGRT